MKLSEDDVLEIRRLRWVENWSYLSLAARYGGGESMMQQIATGAKRGSVPNPHMPRTKPKGIATRNQVYVFRHRHTGAKLERAESREWILGPKAAELHGEGWRLIRDGERVVEYPEGVFTC